MRAGQRVRIISDPVGLYLPSPFGRVVRRDERYDDHWIVWLDRQAVQLDPLGYLFTITEHEDNLEVIE